MDTETDGGKTKHIVQLRSLPRGKAFLCIQVLFRGEPLPALEIQFFKMEDGKQGGQLETTKKTDEEGIAKLDDPVDVGNYLCTIDDEIENVTITTVEDETDPFIVHLPIGTPYFELVQEPTIYAEPEEVDGTWPPESPGRLCIQVLFEGRPMPGLEVSFLEYGAEIGLDVTDADGVAKVGPQVPIGNYQCRIQGRLRT